MPISRCFGTRIIVSVGPQRISAIADPGNEQRIGVHGAHTKRDELRCSVWAIAVNTSDANAQVALSQSRVGGIARETMLASFGDVSGCSTGRQPQHSLVNRPRRLFGHEDAQQCTEAALPERVSSCGLRQTYASCRATWTCRSSSKGYAERCMLIYGDKPEFCTACGFL